MPQKRKPPKHAKSRPSYGGRAPRAKSSFSTSRKRGGTMFAGSSTPKSRRSGRFSTSQAGGRSPFFSPGDGDGFESLSGIPITRRNLLIGAAGVGGIAAVGVGGSYALDMISSGNSSLEHISVPESAVETLDDYEQLDYSDQVSIVSETTFPYGTLAWADNDTYAAILEPTENSTPLNVVKILNLTSGNTATLLDEAEGADEGFQIFDVRCSAEGLIWTEIDVYTSTWRVYTAVISDDEASSILQVDEADAAWITPSIAAVGNKAFWQVVPHADGAAKGADAVLKAATFGSDSVDVLWRTKRPFDTPVIPVSDGVIVTPRAAESSSYHQLVKISASDGTEVDLMTLPQSMTPSYAGYGKTGFAFAFDSIYNYGDGIANLGTYTPKSAGAYDYNDKSWFRFPRTPSAGPSWCGDWFVVKSNRAICGVNFDERTYFLIDPESGVDNYGEYLISTGSSDYIVGLSQIKKSGEEDKSHALVRVFEA